MIPNNLFCCLRIQGWNNENYQKLNEELEILLSETSCQNWLNLQINLEYKSLSLLQRNNEISILRETPVLAQHSGIFIFLQFELRQIFGGI